VRELVRHILAAAPELDDTTAVQIARRLEDRERPVSARDVANHLGLRKTDWVYANAKRLGGWRLGEGKQPRWRFYLSEVEERLHETGASPVPRAITKPEPKPRTPRRGERREGFTTGGNQLIDFGAA
jgi:transposase